MTSEEIFDTESLSMLQDLLGEKFIELIETYLSDSEQRIQRLKTGLLDGDLDVAKHEVHGLKGSSRNLGANALAAVCDILEKQTTEGHVEDGEQQVAAIEQHFAAVTDILKTYL